VTAFVVGLTGSIGMGKSTTAAMFADEGAAVWDADSAVHRLYSQGGAGVASVRALCPSAVADGRVDRTRLAEWAMADSGNLASLEAAIHPLVAADRRAFVASSTADIVVLDIPLLFETRAEADMDLVAVVSTSPDLQRYRVLARPGMTPEKLDTILARQMPDAEKRAKAGVVIDTTTIDGARETVKRIVTGIRDGTHARNRTRHGNHGA